MNERKFPIDIPLNTPDSPDKLYDLASHVLAELSPYTTNARLLKNLRLVLIEMATNFLKHLRKSNVHLLVTIEANHLLITKTYTGTPIKFSCPEACFPFAESGKEVRLSFGNNNDHLICTEGPYSFRFLGPAFFDSDISQLPENYGLSIITLAADRFSYTFDPDTRTNVFQVTMNLH